MRFSGLGFPQCQAMTEEEVNALCLNAVSIAKQAFEKLDTLYNLDSLQLNIRAEAESAYVTFTAIKERIEDAIKDCGDRPELLKHLVRAHSEFSERDFAVTTCFEYLNALFEDITGKPIMNEAVLEAIHPNVVTH